MSDPLHVTFVCTGNICRSPMAEKMFAQQLRHRGLGDAVRVTSAGTGNWHVGSCADERAGGDGALKNPDPAQEVPVKK